MIQKTIKDHKKIIFNGNGYDDSWIKEATKRGLLNYRTTADAIPHLLDKKNVEMLTSHGVFTEAELKSRYEITLENYVKTVIIEANTMVNMAKTQIAPAIESYCADVASSAADKKALVSSLKCKYETELVKKLSELTDTVYTKANELEKAVAKVAPELEISVQANMIRDSVLVIMDELRLAADEAEMLTSKEYWPFPTYGDILFSVK